MAEDKIEESVGSEKPEDFVAPETGRETVREFKGWHLEGTDFRPLPEGQFVDVSRKKQNPNEIKNKNKVATRLTINGGEDNVIIKPNDLMYHK